MARDNNFDDIRRQRELEDEEDQVAIELKKAGAQLSGRIGASRSGDAAIDRLMDHMARAEPLIEQVNNLYNQYITGVESYPPLERRRQLDQLMTSMQGMAKPGPAYQFRYMSLNASFVTHRERWDRLIKDLESGKIKRQLKVRRGG